MKAGTTILAGLLLILCSVTSLSAQTLRLRNGTFLIAEILDVNEDGIKLKRLDNGGQIDLAWKHLVAEDAKRLRVQYNLLGAEEQSQVLIPALRCTYAREDGVKTEIIGELVSRDTQQIVLKRMGNRYPIPIADLRGAPEHVNVPIGDIRTRSEIYEQQLAEIDPGEDADKHTALGFWLMRVDLLEQAKIHLDKAGELGGGSQREKVEGLQKRVGALLLHQEEAELLKRMVIQRNRKRFDKALALAKEFEKKFPSSPLRSEFEQRRDSINAARETHFIKQVTLDWYRVLRDVAGGIAADRSLAIDAAQQKVTDEMGQEIRKRIANKRKLKPNEVEEFFGARHDHKVAKPQKMGYGFGSWLLGKSAILEDTTQGAAEKKQASKKKKDSNAGRARRQFRKRLEEFRRALRGSRGGNQENADALQSPADWWRTATTAMRKQWLIAYYAEKGGDMKVYHASLNHCPTCSARGYIEVQSSEGSKVVRQTCPTCHGTRFQRVIRFK